MAAPRFVSLSRHLSRGINWISNILREIQHGSHETGRHIELIIDFDQVTGLSILHCDGDPWKHGCKT